MPMRRDLGLNNFIPIFGPGFWVLSLGEHLQVILVKVLRELARRCEMLGLDTR